MSRLAICLSGQPRNFEISYQSLLDFYFPNYECDVFIHTWKDTNYSSQFCNKVIENTDDLHGRYIKLFKPKKIMIEDQISFDKTGIKDLVWGCKLDSVLSMFYSIQLVNKLKSKYEREHDFIYDFVMRIRTDLKLIRPIKLEDIAPNHIALFNWTQQNTYNERGYSDVFAIGNSNLMDVYSNAFDKILHYLQTDTSWSFPDSKLRNEYLLKRHLDVNCINIQQFHHGDQTDPSFGITR